MLASGFLFITTAAEAVRYGTRPAPQFASLPRRGYPKDPTKLPNALAATLIGISEDIITALSKLRWFFVIARNSPFIYKARPCI